MKGLKGEADVDIYSRHARRDDERDDGDGLVP